MRQQAVDLLGAQLKDQQDRLAAGSVGQINVNRAQVSLANEQPALLRRAASVADRLRRAQPDARRRLSERRRGRAVPRARLAGVPAPAT